MTLEAHRDDLAATAAALAAPGTGLLAADESTGTIGKRFEAIGLENSEDYRRAYRSLLATAPGLAESISGVILYEETLFQDSSEEAGGAPIVELFAQQGIIPGIKVDQGVEPLAGGLEGETWCTGLKGLGERAGRHYARGARFAKWRAVLRISTGGAQANGRLAKIYPQIENGRVTADVEVENLDTAYVDARILVQVPVGSRKALEMAVKSAEEGRRNSGLCERLRDFLRGDGVRPEKAMAPAVRTAAPRDPRGPRGPRRDLEG
jgi:hypothetical protein